MKTFVTSDIHFNHKNIVVYQPNRGTLDLDKMNENIIRAWNEDVSPEDTVWILGDVAMGKIEKAPALIARLNGKLNLVKGNHDKSLYALTKQDAYVRTLFNEIVDMKQFYHSVDGTKTYITMSHYPMMHWEGQGQGAMMLHGHLHGHPCAVPGRIKDVGMDTNDMRVYDLDRVVRNLRKIVVTNDHHGEV